MAHADSVTTLERFDAFISYAREDSEFVRRLDARLRDLERKTWVDWESVPPGAEFPSRIRAGVDGAANFIFVVSPDSVVSEWCQLELAHAVSRQKRLISIICRQVEPARLPEAIRTFDWIDFQANAFDSALTTLVRVLDTDQKWMDAHTRFLVRAVEWEAKSDDSFLLRGEELQDAVQWLGQAGRVKEPRPSPLQLDYIQASQAAQEEERRRWQELSEKYLAGRLSAESKLTREESPRLLPRSTLLAIESLQRFPSADAHDALSEAVALLPSPVQRVSHDGAVQAVAFSPTGAWCASADCDGLIRISGSETLDTVVAFRQQGCVRALSFSADERYLAAASDNRTASVWDLTTQQLHCSVDHDEAISTVEFAAEGTLLLTGTGYLGHPGVTKLWDVEGGQQVGTVGGVSSCRLFSGGRVLATAEATRVVLRDVATGTVTAELPHDQVVTAFDIHPTEPILAVATFDETLWLWRQADEGRVVRDRVATGISRISPVALSPDGQRVGALRADSEIRVWEAATQAEVFRARHEGSAGLRLLAFQPNGRLLASLSGEDQSIGVWDVETGTPVTYIQQDEAVAMRFAPSGDLLVTAGHDNAAWIWALPSPGAWIWSALVGLTKTLRVSPDGACLAWIGTRVADDGRVVTGEGDLLTVLESATGHQLWSFQHDALIERVAFSADGRLLATSADGAVRVWQAGTGMERSEMRSEAPNWFESPVSVPDFPRAIVSPDRKLFVSPVDESSGVKRVAQTAKVRAIADGHGLKSELRFDGPLTSLAWSPDSGSLASGHVDGLVRLWDAVTGREIARLKRHSDVVAALAFSPGGEWLASAGYEGLLVVWRARPADLISEACARLTRNLTQDEWDHYLGEEEYRRTCPSLNLVT